MQCVFFNHFTLAWFTNGLPVGTFCVRVALMRIELRLDMEVTMALVYFKGCWWGVFDWYGANHFCLNCQWWVEDCICHRGVGVVCKERNLWKREMHFHFQTSAKCGSCVNRSLGGMKTYLYFHNWLLNNYSNIKDHSCRFSSLDITALTNLEKMFSK